MYAFDISPTGWFAEFQEEKDGKRRSWQVTIQCFAPDGNAMMVDSTSARLVPAASIDNFVGLVETHLGVHFLPAQPGWSVEGSDWNGETVIGWMLNDAGYGAPLVALPNSGGVVPAGVDGSSYTLKPPDAHRADRQAGC
ncbi:hypothetical protein [Amycolatopsis sp. lyj-23]|uniref:hypothetical protein n=1 Tax=Amycolatopsis sp. lyj-23 TaxID=2789283 RepID=UPI00397DFE70